MLRFTVERVCSRRSRCVIRSFSARCWMKGGEKFGCKKGGRQVGGGRNNFLLWQSTFPLLAYS